MSPLSAEDRTLLDPLVEVIRAHLELGSSREVHASRIHAFDDEHVVNRNFPLQVASIPLEHPLTDHLVVLGCFRAEVFRELVDGVVGVILDEIDVAATAVGSIDYSELPAPEQAADLMDALWDEPIVSFSLPEGELAIVCSRGMLSAMRGIVVASGGYPGAQRRAAAARPTAAPVTPKAEPVAESEPVAEPVVAPAPLADFSIGADTTDPLALRGLGQSMHHVEVLVSAELGSTRLPLGAIASLGEHAVLTLDQRSDEPVYVCVNGVPFATARLVVVGGEYGIEIISVLNGVDAATYQGLLSEAA